ncbi:MAG: hypothetical protein HYY93_12105 [Planctomycetes bacterium]|nr:hypothetical protein [Planctomycetota bacterium]
MSSSGVKFAILVLVRSKIKPDTAIREWRNVVESILSPRIGENLDLGRPALVVVNDEGEWMDPDTPEMRKGIGKIRKAVLSPRRARWHAPQASTPRLFEAFKILFDAWLRGHGPMPVGKLQESAGIAYPTTARALKILEGRGEILRHSNRSVEISRFPSETWNEILPRIPVFRCPKTYVDASGRRPDPEHLLERLSRRTWNGLAVGGVIAARRWDPGFDLHGVPRLDLCVHIPANPPIFEALSSIEPALQEVRSPKEEIVLAIHPIGRPVSLFEKVGPAGGIPYADPVETLLDLHEMRLVKQADELIEHLKRGGDRGPA